MTENRGLTIATYLSLVPGVFLLISGLLILLAPDAAAVLFDISDADSFKEPLSLAMGIRQVAIGLMITTLVFSNQLQALGIILIVGALVPLADFFLFGPTNGWTSALRHAGPIPLILGLGIYLLLQTRGGSTKK
ncbi:MAG: DUF4267 domain-containing protein [Phaeodactylibacter sp.]|nr:DUF4267 domain-containing protein [Phaeodactylibacter sp.]